MRIKQIFFFPFICLHLCFISIGMASNYFDDFLLEEIPYEAVRKPFICTNEYFFGNFSDELQKIPFINNGVHIGWSIEMNYKIIIAREPKLAILCDINSNVFEFYSFFRQTILSSKSYVNFFELLQLKINRIDWDLKKKKQLTKMHENYSEWMNTEEKFQILKKMYQEGRIIHVVLSANKDESRFIYISEWLKKHEYRVDSLYISNINYWLRGSKENFKRNLQHFVDENTICIDSNDWLNLRITLGQFPLM